MAADSNQVVRKVNPLAFDKSTKPFDDALFQHPTSEYRGCPLWAWNTKLDPAQLRRQIDSFQEMGLGGFHMHVRIGLDTEYMSPEYMDAIKSCVDYAEEKNLLACLYDDDRWPSGVVGGRLIEKHPQYKAKHILFTPNPYGTVGPVGGCAPSSAAACRSENGHLLAKYSITLDDSGNLADVKILGPKEVASSENIWYAYVETNPDSPWFNGQTYVDTLDANAITKFLEMTHEVYKDKVGDRFGSTIPCCFTDEPQFATKTRLPNAQARQDVFLPWTEDLPTTFKAKYGDEADLIEHLPELVWNLPNRQPSATRYRYHDHVCERFVSAYMDQLSAWCGKNNIMLNGHMMEEPTLHSQTTALGEAMRCYRDMQIPGIDLLNDSVEYNTAKQASSVARQSGRKACGSETYGCTHWTFTFEGHKGCSDWQAALGITFRVPHLAWVSMAGEGKRDYPASINYQSPWHKEYGYIEDHFARVNVALTRGKAVTRVGVIHPIESFWLCFGPEQASNEAQWRDEAFSDLTNWLLHGLVDFDFISESLLPEQFGGCVGKKLHVGECAYDIVILPNLKTIRSSTFEIVIQKFVEAGGQVLVAGEVPRYIDGMPSSPGVLAALESSRLVPWDQGLIMPFLEPYRDIRMVPSQPSEANDKLLYQMRVDGEERFVFMCNTDRNNALEGTILLKGQWNIFTLDTLSGSQSWTRSWRSRDSTFFRHKFEGCASLLLRLTPVDGPVLLDYGDPTAALSDNMLEANIEQLDVSLTEPNVLLLDQALYTVGHGNLAGPQEVLQIDNDIREKLHLPRKGSAWKQPWAVPPNERAAKTHVTLRFVFRADSVPTSNTYLALEIQDRMSIQLNEHEIEYVDSISKRRWWVDEAITKIEFDRKFLKKGRNVLELSFPFGVLTNIERVYLLGSFSVKVDGPSASIESSARRLSWGDVTQQGLPFYAGNIEYSFKFALEHPSKVVLSAPKFSSPVLRVDRAGKDDGDWTKVGNIATQPRTLDLGTLGAGNHVYKLTALGNRFNSFGHIHLPDWAGGCWPDQWRTKDSAWVDGYNVKSIGVLEPPKLLITRVG